MAHAITTLLALLWLASASAGTVASPRGAERVSLSPPRSEQPAPAPVVAGGDAQPRILAENQAAPEVEPSPPVISDPKPAAAPQAACLERSVDRIQARYEGVRDLEARFTQTSRPAHLGTTAVEPTVTTGHVVVAKPGKMRWTYEAPEQSLVVSDGTSLWIYDPVFGEAQKLPVTDGYLSGAAIEFLLGEGDMRRDFDIELESCDAKQVTLLLTPREAASYEKLQVVADPSTGDLSQTRVDDLIGNSTTVNFENLRVNLDPDPKLFRFDAPEGVDVIEIEAP